MRALRAAALSLIVMLPAVTEAQGWIIPRCGPPPRPEIRPEPCPDGRVVRTRSDVRVELVDRVLRYEIDERFVNRGNTIGEADYLFPLPKGAAFQDLKLSINGELVAGETMDAIQARRIYEEIVRRQRDPALVEWMGHGLLRTRIFPFNAGEERRVVTRFQVVAEREGDAMRVDYFRGGATREARLETRGSRDDEARSSFTLSYAANVSIGHPYSPTHELRVERDGSRRTVEARGDAKDVTILLPLRRSEGMSVAVLQHAPGNEDGFALITLTPPRASRAASTPRDITLVIDVSGSMSGRKLAQAKAAGRQVLGTLRRGDRFRIVDFSTGVRTFRDELVSATDANIAAAERYLDDLTAEGGTNIGGALDEALRPRASSERLSLVLFLTDGAPTVGLRDPAEIAARAARERGERRIFTFGVGTDVNVSLIEQLALEGRGTAHFVRPNESVERAVGIVASRLVDPVMTNVRIRGDGVRLSRIHPEQPFDIFEGQDLIVFARYRGDGRARVVFEGETRRGPVRWETPVLFADRERGNSFIARLWATQRVGYLSAERRKNGASAEIDAEIRSLGEQYGIPTEFTSYFVKEPGMDLVDGRRLPMATGNATSSRRGAGAARSESAVATAAPAAPHFLMRVDTAAAGTPSDFEQARKAAEQRSAVSLGAVTVTSGGVGDQTRVAGGHAFRLIDGRWTDTRYKSSMTVTKVKPYSKAYFALLDAAPRLREMLALGERVLVAAGTSAIEIGAGGVEELSPAQVQRLVATLGGRE